MFSHLCHIAQLYSMFLRLSFMLIYENNQDYNNDPRSDNIPSF